MKKFVFIALSAAALMSAFSCSKSELVATAQQEDNAISFGVYTGRTVSTKAATTTASIQATDAGFGVLAYYTEGNFEATAKPNFMYDQQVTYSGTAWEYSPIKYWPKNYSEKVSFFAYAPYAKTNMTLSGNSVADAPTITYTLPENLQGTDIVVAQVMNQNMGDNNGAANSVTDKVTFVFKHITTRVKFGLVANEIDEEANTAIVVKSINILNGTGAKGPEFNLTVQQHHQV